MNPAGKGRTSWDSLGASAAESCLQVASVLVLMLLAWLKPSCPPSPGVRFPESCQDEVRDQKQLLKDAAAFLLSCQIPGLVREGPEGGGCRRAVADLGASCSRALT